MAAAYRCVDSFPMTVALGLFAAVGWAFVTLRLAIYLGKPWFEAWRDRWQESLVMRRLAQPMVFAFVPALVVMMIAGRVLPWYREVQRREEGRKPPVLSLMLTQGIAFGAILLLIQTVLGML